jgi:hypothetical protein
MCFQTKILILKNEKNGCKELAPHSTISRVKKKNVKGSRRNQLVPLKLLQVYHYQTIKHPTLGTTKIQQINKILRTPFESCGFIFE